MFGLGFFFFHFFYTTKSCFYLFRLERQAWIKGQDSWIFTVVVLCFFTQSDENVKSLAWVFMIAFPEPYCVHWNPGPDFRSTMEGTSLPPASYLDSSINSHLQTVFLPFFSLGYWNCWFFCSLLYGSFQYFNSSDVPEVHSSLFWNRHVKKRDKPSGFAGWLKPTLTQVWKQHISQNGNMSWEL